MNNNIYAESNYIDIDNTPKIRVVIRKRPINKKELLKNDTNIIEIRGSQTLVVRETKLLIVICFYN